MIQFFTLSIKCVSLHQKISFYGNTQETPTRAKCSSFIYLFYWYSTLRILWYACSDDAQITRYDANMQHLIAAKDSEIALLKSEQSTDKKLVDVYAALKVSENNLRDRVKAAYSFFFADVDAPEGKIWHYMDAMREKE